MYAKMAQIRRQYSVIALMSRNATLQDMGQRQVFTGRAIRGVP